MGETDIEKRHYPLKGRCNAKNRNGQPCRKHPVAGRSRCRLHGGLSPTGVNHGRYKHGYYSKEFIELLRENRENMRMIKQYIRMMQA